MPLLTHTHTRKHAHLHKQARKTHASGTHACALHPGLQTKAYVQPWLDSLCSRAC